MSRRIGPPDAPATFQPQWAERTLEEEMDGGRGEDECRLCACIESSACEGGCWWAEEDLCSSCDQLRQAFPMLMIADGYGIAAYGADLRRRIAEFCGQRDWLEAAFQLTTDN